jgi:16S rRNA (guanine527-N7)-methyltransferase
VGSDGIDIDGDLEHMLALARDHGLEIPGDATATLGRFARILLDWNGRVNLISRKDIGRLVSYHFCDSASLLPLLGRTGRLRLLDIGGSNGLPGAVLAVMREGVELTIADARRKRAGFLREVCDLLGDRARFELSRVNNRDFLSRCEGSFDLIVARAVTDIGSLWKWCFPLLRPGGLLIGYKGSRSLEEVERAGKDLFRRGVLSVLVMESPWKHACNPLRKFVLVERARGRGVQIG